MAGNIAPNKLELIITIVDHHRAAYYTHLIQSYDANIQINVQAKGTAEAELLQYLGLSDSHKTVIFSVVREDRMSELMAVLDEKFKSVRGGKGVAVSVPFSSVIGALIYGFLSNDERTVREDMRS